MTSSQRQGEPGGSEASRDIIASPASQVTRALSGCVRKNLLRFDPGRQDVYLGEWRTLCHPIHRTPRPTCRTTTVGSTSPGCTGRIFCGRRTECGRRLRRSARAIWLVDPNPMPPVGCSGLLSQRQCPNPPPYRCSVSASPEWPHGAGGSGRRRRNIIGK